MIFISVMYKDLKIKKVPIEEIDSLPKDGVLFIKLVTDTREGKLAGISMSHSLDNYAVLHKIEKKADWYMLTGWDDDQFIWRRECGDCENRKVVDLPSWDYAHYSSEALRLLRRNGRKRYRLLIRIVIALFNF